MTSSCPQAVHTDPQQHTSHNHMEDDFHVQGEQRIFFPRGSCFVLMGCPRSSTHQPRWGGGTGQVVQEDLGLWAGLTQEAQGQVKARTLLGAWEIEV